MDGAVRVVLQRCDSAELLLDGTSKWAKMGRGIIAYVSFASEASEDQLRQAAKTIIHLPLVTLGQWGDGSDLFGIADFCARPNIEEAASIMCVPQANLASKVKGKTVNSRDLHDRDASQTLYWSFIRVLRQCAWEIVHPPTVALDAQAMTERMSAKAKLGEIPPHFYFQNGAFAGKFSVYDNVGMPTHDANGVEVGKTQRKKYERLMRQQEEKYTRYMAKFQSNGQKTSTITTNDTNGTAKDPSATTTPDSTTTASITDESARQENEHDPGDPRVVKVIAGTFGNRQGMRITAECGPFFHMFSC